MGGFVGVAAGVAVGFGGLAAFAGWVPCAARAIATAATIAGPSSVRIGLAIGCLPFCVGRPSLIRVRNLVLGDAALVVGHRAAVADRAILPGEGERPGGDPPFEEVVGETAGLDGRVAVAQPGGLLEARGEDREAAHGDVGLLAERPIGDQLALALQVGPV